MLPLRAYSCLCSHVCLFSGLLVMPPKITDPTKPKINLFCISAYASAGLYHSNLLPHLPPNTYIYIFVNPKLKISSCPFQTIRELCGFYSKIMKKIQPNGPYWIMSYSFCCYHAMTLGQVVHEQDPDEGKPRSYPLPPPWFCCFLDLRALFVLLSCFLSSFCFFPWTSPVKTSAVEARESLPLLTSSKHGFFCSPDFVISGIHIPY